MVILLLVVAVKFYPLVKEKVEDVINGVDKKQVRKMSSFAAIILMIAIYGECVYYAEHRKGSNI